MQNLTYLGLGKETNLELADKLNQLLANYHKFDWKEIFCSEPAKAMMKARRV